MINKTELKTVFGSYAATGRAVGVTRGAVSQWPDTLPNPIADRVISAAVRLGKKYPQHWHLREVA